MPSSACKNKRLRWGGGWWSADGPVLPCLTSVRHGFFFFNDTATTEIYTLSLHDALPIWSTLTARSRRTARGSASIPPRRWAGCSDRKSTRLNSSHVKISYAVFCLKKKKKTMSSNIIRKKKDKEKFQ